MFLQIARLLRFALLSLCLLAAGPTARAQPADAAGPGADRAALPTVHVGIAIDGPSVMIDQATRQMRRELEVLTRGEMNVRFEDRHLLSGGWSLDGARGALETLLADPEVDLILAVGLLSSQQVCCLGALAKPVIATTVLDTALQNLPRQGESSGFENLVYVELYDGTLEELEAFYNIVPFEKPVFLTSRDILQGMPELIASAEREIRSVGLEARFVGIGDSADEALAEIDALGTGGVDAVYVWPLYRLDQPELERLVEGLTERRVPTFSALGGRDMDAGMMATQQSRGLLTRLARRVALNAQRVLLGEPASQIPVRLSSRPQLTLNMGTAREVGIEPRWETLLEARIVEDEPDPRLERLDLTTMVSRVVAANLDLEADRLGVRAAERNVAVARSAFRPSLEAGILGVTIDDDRAEASFGQQAERTLQASLTASQLIFSDGASAGVEIEKALYEARQASYDTLTLDIAFEAGVSYLNLLRAETLQRVRRNNLDLTRSNLELAELRVEVGAANPSETFRWQSQIASDRQELIAAAAQVQQAQLAVNRLMHRDLETRFATVEIGLTSEFLIDQGDISGFIATPERFAVTRDFTVQEGLRNSPLLRTLGASLDAQSRQLKAARRAFYLPQVAAQLSLDHLLETAGAGSDVAVPAGSPSADDTSWSLSLSASLPLLTGGARRAQQLQAEEEVRRLETEVEAASERIAESIRAAMIATRASFLAIDLAEQAAAAASRSQDLVADAYARGNVSIIDLLDAQNAFLNAELAAANAVYDFFIDLLQVERAASRFYILDEPAERDAWLERLLAYFNERGLDVWRPTPFRQPDPDPASTAAGGVR